MQRPTEDGAGAPPPRLTRPPMVTPTALSELRKRNPDWQPKPGQRFGRPLRPSTTNPAEQPASMEALAGAVESSAMMGTTTVDPIVGMVDPIAGATEPTVGMAEPTAGTAEPTVGATEPTTGGTELTAGAVELTAGTEVPATTAEGANVSTS